MIPTVQEDQAAVNFDHALMQAAARAKATYPAETQRIERGLQIAQADGVTLFADGSAMVASQSHPGEQYTVNGHCRCKGAMSAPSGRCAHRWAKSLVRFAQKALAHRPAAQYYATYWAPDGRGHPGIATWTDRGWLFASEDGTEYLYAAIQALAFGGNCAIADAKRAEEEGAGGLAWLVCGTPQRCGGCGLIGCRGDCHR